MRRHPSNQPVAAKGVWFWSAFVCALLVASSARAHDTLTELPPLDRLVPVAFDHRSLSSVGAPQTGDEDNNDDAVKARLAKLEQNYADLSEDYKKLKIDYQSINQTLKTSAASRREGATMTVDGRIHADLWTFPDSDAAINTFETGNPLDSPQDVFGFRRLRFGVKGNLWQTMLYKIEMEFALGADSQFRDAYFGCKDLPLVQQVLIGNQKRPYGLDQLNSSRYNVFLERPFVIESFNQDARRLGIQSYGVSADENWNWRYGVFNQRLVQDEGNYRSDHWQLELAGRMANTFWYDEASGGRGYGHWAVSGSAAHPDGTAGDTRADNEARFRGRPEARSASRWFNTGRIDGADNYQLLGLENVWNFGSLQLVGEYQHVWLQRDAGFGPNLDFNGAYVYAAYFLTGEHMPWSRSSGTLDCIKPLENFFLVGTCTDGLQAGWGAWQIAYRWSYADFNDDNIFGGRGNSHTLGLNWYWNANTRMQFNAIYGKIEDAAISAGVNDNDVVVTIPAQSGEYTILGVRLMVSF